jgi:hypothetical protein
MALTLEGWGHDVKDWHWPLRSAGAVRYPRVSEPHDDEVMVLLLGTFDQTEGARNDHGFQYAVAHQKP